MTTSPDETETTAPASLQRRRFVGYLVAAPTLAVAVSLGDDLLASPAGAVIPTLPGPYEIFDLNDLLVLAAQPTSHLITMTLGTDGKVHFALPRSENGQGITTSTAMLIADEMDLPLSSVEVTLADARPELLFNQLTGGSNTTISTYRPIRAAAAAARQQLLATAAKQTGFPTNTLRTRDGAVITPDGRTLAYGALTEAAAVSTTRKVSIRLRADAELTLVGTPQNRIDAREAVTGEKQFTMDLKVEGAEPTMVCRPPTINGKVGPILNLAEVEGMPGVTHVQPIATGIAVRARTFGQCMDAVRALRVAWGAGPLDTLSDADVLTRVRRAELPLLVPKLPLLAKSVEADFTFWFASNGALETNCAIADVRSDGAEIWAGLKSPITAQQEIARRLKLPASKVKVHVVQGGGSFGRKLFFDAALEAAEASQKMGVPVKLMWHRADDFRQGRVHPMATSRIRATVLGREVLTYEQRHTSVFTDFSHGLGEIITANLARLPVGDIGFSQTVYMLSQAVHYNFGVTTQLLNEADIPFNTSSMRNIYSPNTATARELFVDKLAASMGQDPYLFRRKFVRDARARAVLDKVAQVGGWGRAMPAGTAQGIAIHNEYHGFSACLVEIDCRPETVNRQVPDAVTGPRVTKVVFAVDVGLPVNPRGLEAQMMGGIMDGIALILTSSLHLKDGHFLEASWDNYAYTRQWNVPPQVEVIVMPQVSGEPGGAGEFGVAATCGAVAAAYARATGTMPKEFPINHKSPLHFAVRPTVPPIPESPTDGLAHTF